MIYFVPIAAILLGIYFTVTDPAQKASREFYRDQKARRNARRDTR